MPARDRLKEPQAQAPQAPDLLAFYQGRAEEFETERAELLERIERLGVQATDQHQLVLESRRRAEEVHELQKALSDAHAFLFEERQRLLALQAENDELRLQEIEDRKRIEQLLGSGKQQQHAQYSTDVLLLKIESLQAQLNEQKQLAAERVAALLEDRRIRETEEEGHRRHMSQQLEQATAAVARLEEQLRQTTKDYILAKRDKQTAEEKALTCEAALLQERQRVGEEQATIKRRHDKEVREVRSQVEAKMDDVTTNLRQQLRTKEEELSSLTSVHTALKSQYDSRLAELEDKVVKLTANNKQLEQRRHLDMEGFTADITYLRKMLTAVDRKLHEMRLKDRLEDDERLDAILSTLRRKAPVPAPQAAESAGGRSSEGAGGHGSGRNGGRHGMSDTTPMSDTNSIKDGLREGLRDIGARIQGLEGKLASRKKGLQHG